LTLLRFLLAYLHVCIEKIVLKTTKKNKQTKDICSDFWATKKNVLGSSFPTPISRRKKHSKSQNDLMTRKKKTPEITL